MQKAKNSSAEHPLDTFAPTIRHSSHKCLVAQACMDGAANTSLSSRAYLSRIANETLPKPLAEYPLLLIHRAMASYRNIMKTPLFGERNFELGGLLVTLTFSSLFLARWEKRCTLCPLAELIAPKQLASSPAA